MTKLTIAIPNYNGGENLHRAIESCQKIVLLPEEFEILVVDNCSTDNSIEIVTELKNRFANLKLIQNSKNVGRIENWNICIDNAKGEFLIFLFSNDLINNTNNIDECLRLLEKNENISMCFSSLLKKDVDRTYIKKSFSEKIIECNSRCFSKECLNRGLLPFGPIQALIYRVNDIKKDQSQFRIDMPINADEIFTYKEAVKREKILFSPKPQITWDLTQGRFHGQMKIEDEFKEHSETIKIISEDTGIQVDYGLVSTYRAINLLKFSTSNLKSKGKKDATKQLVSKMKQSKSFFNMDKILLKTFVEKIKNSKKDADDLLYSTIISECQKLKSGKSDK